MGGVHRMSLREDMWKYEQITAESEDKENDII